MSANRANANMAGPASSTVNANGRTRKVKRSGLTLTLKAKVNKIRRLGKLISTYQKQRNSLIEELKEFAASTAVNAELANMRHKSVLQKQEEKRSLGGLDNIFGRLKF